MTVTKMLFDTEHREHSDLHLVTPRAQMGLSDTQNGQHHQELQQHERHVTKRHCQHPEDLGEEHTRDSWQEHCQDLAELQILLKPLPCISIKDFHTATRKIASPSNKHIITCHAEDTQNIYTTHAGPCSEYWPGQATASRIRCRRFGCAPTKFVCLFGLTVCLFMFVGQCESKPVSEAERKYRELRTNTVKYLAQFGYLKGPSREAPDLRSQEDLTRAIKALQKAGGIPQTGVPDSRTEALMTRPRCGNTDDFVDDVKAFNDNDENGFKIRKRRYTLATSKWDRTNITFRFVNYTPDMPQAKTRQLISDAFRVWSDATPLSFTEVRDSSADIMIMFASQYHSDGYPFDGKGMVLGHAFFPGHGKGGDTHFDDDENWTTNSSDGVDLFMVAAHEFGHAIGLAHSGDPSALMYPWYMGFDGTFKLPEDDLRGITSLYGTGELDHYLPDKTKVSLIPNTNLPVLPTATDVGPTNPPDEVDKNAPADPCSSHIDAITVFRTEIFLFIGKWFWRLDSRKVVTKPIDIHQFWYGLPKHLEKIDAVFVRPDNKIVFFSGDRYWVFNANQLIAGFPPEGRPITEFNIPADVKNIDAAFVWGYNSRTYLVSGDMYWKMNENNTFVEYDYPRDMGTWKGVPVPLNAAFKDLSGKTIFFQGLDFWEFYDMKMRTRRGYPKRISQHWLNCPGVAQSVEKKYESLQKNDDHSGGDDEGDVENSADPQNQFSILVLIVACLMYTVSL